MTKEKEKSVSFVGILVSTLLIALIFSFGAVAAWSTLARWFPTEEVAVRIIGNESRNSVRYNSRGGSPTYWIEVVDGNGLSQNIVCIGETYSALRKGSILGGSLKLIRNPLFKTPVAFLHSPPDALKIDPDSALGKVLAAGGDRKSSDETQRLELMKYPLVFLVIGVVMMGGALWMFMRVLKIYGNRRAAITINLIAVAIGTGFGIYWSSGLL